MYRIKWLIGFDVYYYLNFFKINKIYLYPYTNIENNCLQNLFNHLKRFGISNKIMLILQLYEVYKYDC